MIYTVTFNPSLDYICLLYTSPVFVIMQEVLLHIDVIGGSLLRRTQCQIHPDRESNYV